MKLKSKKSCCVADILILFGGPGRIRTAEVRGRQIYSLMHLTALPPTHFR